MTDLLSRPDAVVVPFDDHDFAVRRTPARLAVPSTAMVTLAVVLACAGVIHLAMAPTHLDESTLVGTGFVLAGWAQLVLAAVLGRRRTRWALVATIACSAALIAIWAASRTVGLDIVGHGEVEDVTVVDGACVALEAVALGLAALGFRARRTTLNGRVVGATAAVLLTTAALASPAARDHAHGHDELDAHDVVDDRGFSALQNGQMGSHDHGAAATAATAALDPDTAGLLATQLAMTAPLAAQFPTIADAKAAGYRQAGPFSPGLGIHYSRFTGLNNDGALDPADIADPFLIYDGTGDDAHLAGFMYMMYGAEPEGFAGPLDRWHIHTNVCIVTGPNGIETPFGADLTDVTHEMCQAEGGMMLDVTGYMVHVWTVPGYESELGTFSDLNPRITCPDGSYYTVPTAEIGGRDSTCRNP